jgi:hypothetical protein
MKRYLSALIGSAVLFSSTPVCSEEIDGVDMVRQQTEDLYRTSSGSQDATFNAVGKSMIAWGLGLSAVIAILAAAIHQSAAPETTTTTQ